MTIPTPTPPAVQPMQWTRFPDGLSPPEPNTGRGHHARPTPGHHAQMNQGNMAEEINAEIEFPSDDDHVLFSAVASLPEDEDEPEFALASEPGDEPSWHEAITGP